MSKIKTIIVDDEPNGRENLHGILEKYFPDVLVVDQASSAMDAIQSIEKHFPDLVFLDIEMPGASGFEVLNHFKEPKFKVIFVTAFDQYAIQAIRFSALDYILKPIDVIEIKNALKRYSLAVDSRIENFKHNHLVSSEEKKIALTFSDKVDFIKVKDIISCKGEGGYTKIFLVGKTEVMTSKPLMEYEELLNEFGFVRTHKAHLVNANHINSFVKKDGGYLLMDDQSMVPVARRKKDLVIKLIERTSL